MAAQQKLILGDLQVNLTHYLILKYTVGENCPPGLKIIVYVQDLIGLFNNNKLYTCCWGIAFPVWTVGITSAVLLANGYMSYKRFLLLAAASASISATPFNASYSPAKAALRDVASIDRDCRRWGFSTSMRTISLVAANVCALIYTQSDRRLLSLALFRVRPHSLLA